MRHCAGICYQSHEASSVRSLGTRQAGRAAHEIVRDNRTNLVTIVIAEGSKGTAADRHRGYIVVRKAQIHRLGGRRRASSQASCGDQAAGGLDHIASCRVQRHLLACSRQSGIKRHIACRVQDHITRS